MTASEERRYGDHRPYPVPPSRLADLTGPTSGVVEVPVTIDWGASAATTSAPTPTAESSTSVYSRRRPTPSRCAATSTEPYWWTFGRTCSSLGGSGRPGKSDSPS